LPGQFGVLRQVLFRNEFPFGKLLLSPEKMFFASTLPLGSVVQILRIVQQPMTTMGGIRKSDSSVQVMSI
jgi:hypothetical protein